MRLCHTLWVQLCVCVHCGNLFVLLHCGDKLCVLLCGFSYVCVCALWVQILHFDFKFILLRKQEEFDIFPFVYVEIGMILSKDLLIILNSPNF